jgi:hypothetical protein
MTSQIEVSIVMMHPSVVTEHSLPSRKHTRQYPLQSCKAPTCYRRVITITTTH